MTDYPKCQSCGMPMRAPEEFGGGRTDNPYCVYCTDDCGELKPYDVVLENMAQFAIRTMGVSADEAKRFACEGMAAQPAWRGRKE